MTQSVIGRRLAKLEASSRSSWDAWLRVPVQQWPDHLLAAFIVDEATMMPTEKAQAALAAMPDEFLQAIAEGRTQ